MVKGVLFSSLCFTTESFLAAAMWEVMTVSILYTVPFNKEAASDYQS